MHSIDVVWYPWCRMCNINFLWCMCTGCSSLLPESVNPVFSVSAVSLDEFEIICTHHNDTVSDEWNCSAHCSGPHHSENLLIATSGMNTSLTITLEHPCDGLTCYCNMSATIGENIISGQVILFSLRGDIHGKISHSGWKPRLIISCIIMYTVFDVCRMPSWWLDYNSRRSEWVVSLPIPWSGLLFRQ